MHEQRDDRIACTAARRTRALPRSRSESYPRRVRSSGLAVAVCGGLLLAMTAIACGAFSTAEQKSLDGGAGDGAVVGSTNGDGGPSDAGISIDAPIILAYVSHAELLVRGYDGAGWTRPVKGVSLPSAVSGAFVVPARARDGAIAVGVQWQDGVNAIHEVFDLAAAKTPLSSRGLTADDGSTRSFDLVSEASSGDLLFVHRGTNGLQYATRTSAGWSAPDDVPGFGGAVARWVDLVARPKSDEVMLLVSRSDGSLVGAVWDGTAWQQPVTISTQVTITKWQPFAGAYAMPSGKLVVVFEKDGVDALSWRARPSAGTFGTAAAVLSGYPGGPLAFAAQGQGDEVALAFLEDHPPCNLATCDDFVTGIWSGKTSTWQVASVDTDIQDSYDRSGTAPVFVGWAQDRAAAGYHKASEGLRSTRRAPDAGWSSVGEASFGAPMASVKSSFATAPLPSGALLVLVHDVQGRLWAKSFDGATWSDADETKPLVEDLVATSTMPFGVVAR